MCHAGALSAAKGVFEEVMASGLLQCLLDRGECPEGGDSSIDWAQVSGFDLMLVGHSLGGAIASLLSQLFVSNPTTSHWSSRIRCRLISPVGGLYTRAAADATDENSYSVTLDDEAVTSLSRNTVEVMRDEGLMLLAACPYHKLTILLGGLKTFFYSPETLANQAKQQDSFLLDFPQESSNGARKFEWARNSLLVRKCSGGPLNVVETCFATFQTNGYAEPMYAPGKMIHLFKSLNSNSYDAVYVTKDDLVTGGHVGLKVLLPDAILDHFPWFMINALDDVMRNLLMKEV
jgi:hypothetical protein